MSDKKIMQSPMSGYNQNYGTGTNNRHIESMGQN